jgi:rhamnosyltransferase
LFVSGRIRPVDERWLAPLIAALDEDPQAAGVCSRVAPKPGAGVLTAKDGARELSASNARQRKVIADWDTYRRMSVAERRTFLNFHTVSALLRAEVFARIQFRSVITLGEDLAWAREVLEAGWALVHEPASGVYHSHEYSLRELFARNVDDGVANREINDRELPEEEVLPLVRALVLDDWSHLRDALALEGEELTHLQVDAVLRRVAQVVGQWVGANHRDLPPELVATFSGVHQARRAR